LEEKLIHSIDSLGDAKEEKKFGGIVESIVTVG
jgi:hypothetical protein